MIKQTNKQVIFNILYQMKPGQIFTGYGLAKQLKRLTGRTIYPSTCLSYSREFRDLYAVDIECLNNKKSIYKIIG